MKTIHFILLLVVVIGCNEQVNDPTSLTPYERWRSKNLHNYSIEQVRFCFCDDGGEKMNIIIRSDTVFSVKRISDSTIIPSPTSRLFHSIDSLFGIIRNSKGDSLVVTYNAEYGFPEKLDINPQLNPVDGGVKYETSYFKPFQ